MRKGSTYNRYTSTQRLGVITDSAMGMSNRDIADKHKLRRRVVWKWRKDYEALSPEEQKALVRRYCLDAMADAHRRALARQEARLVASA